MKSQNADAASDNAQPAASHTPFRKKMALSASDAVPFHGSKGTLMGYRVEVFDAGGIRAFCTLQRDSAEEAKEDADFLAAAPETAKQRDELLAEGKTNDELLTKLHTAANRVLELFSAQYIRAYDDGGRVKHAMKQLNEALADTSERHSRAAIASAMGGKVS